MRSNLNRLMEPMERAFIWWHCSSEYAPLKGTSRACLDMPTSCHNRP